MLNTSEISASKANNKNDVELFYFSLPADERAYRQIVLTDEELARSEAYKHHTAKQLYIYSRRLIRLALAQTLALPEDGLLFSKGVYGKPFVCRDGLCGKDISYNLSHSKRQIVLAISSDREVGVDIEYIHRRNDILKIAHHYFADLELSNLRTLPVSQQKDRFFDLWTLKESYIKAVGRGLALGLANFSFSFDENCAAEQRVSLVRDNMIEDSIAHWFHRVFALDTDYRVALTAQQHVANEKITIKERYISLEELLLGEFTN